MKKEGGCMTGWEKVGLMVMGLSLLFCQMAAAGEIQRKIAAESIIEQVAKRGTIRVGMDVFVPWAMKNKKGELIGFEIDVARQLAEDMGVKVEFVPTKWSGIIPALIAGKFDVIISIGTLQSSTINFKPFFMDLVQNYLEKNSAIILGFPNSRWIGGEMVYGAKAPNYVMSEMSLVLNDIIFAKKYLQQHKYRVTITGKEYLFLTATKIEMK